GERRGGAWAQRWCNTLPAQDPTQRVFSQVHRFFYAYASMTEGPLGLGEQGARRRIVEIHLKAVGEHEFNCAKWIFWSGFLPQAIRKIFGTHLIPIDATRVHIV